MRSAQLLRAATTVAALSLGLNLGCSNDAAGPGAQYAGGWSGSTSQGRPVHFLVTDGAIVVTVVSFQVVGAVCTDDVLLAIGRDPSQTAFVLSGNALAVTSTGGGGSVSLTGTLDGATASGALSITAVACQGSGDFTWTAQKATGAEADVGGSWDATFSSNLVSPTPGLLILSQSGTNVTGSYSVATGAQGTVSATVSGRMATVRLSQTTPGCTGQFNGYATLLPSVEALLYFYAGQDCLGTHTGGFGLGNRVVVHAGIDVPSAARPRIVVDR